MKLPGQDTIAALSPERADRLRKLYQEELVRRVREKRPQARLWGGADDIEPEVKDKGIAWADFRLFLWDQERELWEIFQELDKNEDGRLDAADLRSALAKSGIDITPTTVQDLVRFLASGSSPNEEGLNKGSEDMYVTFQEFRDFLIMLPRKATPFEIYKCAFFSGARKGKLTLGAVYQVRKRFSDGRGAARVDKEGDINVSFPKKPGESSTSGALFGTASPQTEETGRDGDEFGDDEEGHTPPEDKHEAWKFLLAGGEAGAGEGARSSGSNRSADELAAVSRTVTAPFDRLKVYLITTENVTHFDQGAKGGLFHPFRSCFRAVTNLWGAVTQIYVEGGGLKAFWVGNGLNIIKIFPVRHWLITVYSCFHVGPNLIFAVGICNQVCLLRTDQKAPRSILGQSRRNIRHFLLFTILRWRSGWYNLSIRNLRLGNAQNEGTV